MCKRIILARILKRYTIGCAMAQAVSRRPLTAVVWVRAQVNPMGFVVDKVALGQVLSISFHRGLHFYENSTKILRSFIHSPFHSSSSGDGQKSRKSGRSPVRRQSHPHNQNTRKRYTYLCHFRSYYFKFIFSSVFIIILLPFIDVLNYLMPKLLKSTLPHNNFIPQI
jgi:hypothetical protein